MAYVEDTLGERRRALIGSGRGHGPSQPLGRHHRPTLYLRARREPSISALHRRRLDRLMRVTSDPRTRLPTRQDR